MNPYMFAKMNPETPDRKKWAGGHLLCKTQPRPKRSSAPVKKAAVDKAGFKKRVERLLQTQRAQRVAANCAKGLRKVCQEVLNNAGGPTRS